MGKKTELGTLLVVLISIFIKIMGGVDLLANDNVNYRPEISTTFAKVISERLSWKVIYESVIDNPSSDSPP